MEIYGSYVLGDILLSAASVAWSWFVLAKRHLNRWFYMIFVSPGLFIVFYPLIYFSPAGSILYMAYFFSPAFQIYLTGGIVAMVGIIKILFQNERPRGLPRGIKEHNPPELRSKLRGIPHPAKAG